MKIKMELIAEWGHEKGTRYRIICKTYIPESMHKASIEEKYLIEEGFTDSLGDPSWRYFNFTNMLQQDYQKIVQSLGAAFKYRNIKSTK